MPLTVEQVNGLAPDGAAAKTGRGLASVRQWPSFGRQGEALWGLCQGSGAKPYQVRIDLANSAYKCSCPSMKFPCKHSLGLMYLYAENPALFAEEKPCDFLAEWLADREKRAEQKAKKQAEVAGEIAVAPEILAKRQGSQVKRTLAREEKVAAGIAELSVFLQDLVREGLAALSSKPFSFWDGVAARLIDAQAPGLARQLSELGSDCHAGTDWQTRFLHRLGRLQLACQGWSRLEQLPEKLQADLRAFIGFTVVQEEVLTGTGISGTWSVLARQVTQEDKLRLCRTWLWSASGQPAIIFQYAHANQAFEMSPGIRRTIQAELVFYPSATPIRALLKTLQSELSFQVPSGLPGIDAMLADYAQQLAGNPWLDRRPYLLDQIMPVYQDGLWLLQDAGSQSPALALPLRIRGNQGWRILASGGGRPLSLFGEWDGEQFEPLSLIDAAGSLHRVVEEEGA